MKLYKPREAAQRLLLSVSTLERMRGNGTGPDFQKLGTGKRARVAYRAEDLDAWLEARRFQSTSQYPRKG